VPRLDDRWPKSKQWFWRSGRKVHELALLDLPILPRSISIAGGKVANLCTAKRPGTTGGQTSRIIGRRTPLSTSCVAFVSSFRVRLFPFRRNKRGFCLLERSPNQRMNGPERLANNRAPVDLTNYGSMADDSPRFLFDQTS
jgi:hypothetical protein